MCGVDTSTVLKWSRTGFLKTKKGRHEQSDQRGPKVITMITGGAPPLSIQRWKSILQPTLNEALPRGTWGYAADHSIQFFGRDGTLVNVARVKDERKLKAVIARIRELGVDRNAR